MGDVEEDGVIQYAQSMVRSTLEGSWWVGLTGPENKLCSVHVMGMSGVASFYIKKGSKTTKKKQNAAPPDICWT
jgi:hypothetical protein